jgi:hypothetical protein
MKKALLLLSILTIGCSKPKLKKYVERIKYNDDPAFEIDTIEATTDKAAYFFAIEYYYQEIESNKGLKIISFSIKNSAGVNIDKSLPPSTKDSIDSYWRNRHNNLKN